MKATGDSDDILCTWRDGAVLWAEIDRPGALNAIDWEVMERLEVLLDQLDADRSLRALVLRGAGDRAFISGGDLKVFAALSSEEDAARMATRMKAILDRFESLDCWVIACVNGAAFGGGCETLLAADIRIACEEATFGFTQTRFAVPCGWGGMTRLVERVGHARALAWLGRCETISAQDALDANLVEEVVPRGELESFTQEYAARLCERSREMIGALKFMAGRHREVPRRQAIEDELEPFARLWASDTHHERVRAFLGE